MSLDKVETLTLYINSVTLSYFGYLHGVSLPLPSPPPFQPPPAFGQQNPQMIVVNGWQEKSFLNCHAKFSTSFSIVSTTCFSNVTNFSRLSNSQQSGYVTNHAKVLLKQIKIIHLRIFLQKRY